MSDSLQSSHYTLKVEGGEAIELKEGDIETAEFRVDSPNDADARSNKVAMLLEVTGKISHGKNESETMKLAKWSLIPAGAKDVERKVTIELVKANKVLRQYSFSHAFVVDYTETISDEGTGTYKILLKQNRSISGSKVTIEGGYDK